MERKRPDRREPYAGVDENLQSDRRRIQYDQKGRKIEDAKYYVDLVFRKKAAANDIEVEILRREINHGKEE